MHIFVLRVELGTTRRQAGAEGLDSRSIFTSTVTSVKRFGGSDADIGHSCWIVVKLDFSMPNRAITG